MYYKDKNSCEKYKKIIITVALFVLVIDVSFAHEPLYGLGPDVLFKGALNPHLTFQAGRHETENEFALGYGITRNWTGIVETPFLIEKGKYNLESVMLKSNYRFYKSDKPGLSYKAAFISELELPRKSGEAKTLLCALTTGQEALRFYWFTFLGYQYNLTNNSFADNNEVKYGLAVGMRFNKPDYYKPDLVFLLEGTGSYHQKFEKNTDAPAFSGGNSGEIAPTFILTYRNWALRGGVQFGVINTGDIEKTETSAKITIEVHL